MPLLVTIVATVAVIATVAVAMRVIGAARRREQAAIESADEATQLKNEFVSMVSHELRTPLTSIAGFAETLLAAWRDLPGGEVDEFLRIISTQAHHLGELVEDVLVIPRLEAGRMQIAPTEFDLAELAHEVSTVLFPAGGAKDVSVSIPSGVMAYADRRRVQQILRNLAENARKYGGDQVLIEGIPLRGQYLVVVVDNGPGIPQEDHERIFEHFEQVTKGDNRTEDGIGLGLPIARRLARAMGGDVWYEARFPTGSRFCFTVKTPAAVPPSESDQTADVVDDPEHDDPAPARRAG